MAFTCHGKTRYIPLIAPVIILTLGLSDNHAQENGISLDQPYIAMSDTGYSSVAGRINSNLTAVNSKHTKSVSRAFFYSLLVPGLGEAYIGHNNQAKFFLTMEAVGWGFFLANNLQVKSRTADYQNYAVEHAGLDRTGKDAQYWIDIGKFDDIYDHNEQRRRERDVSSIYPENDLYFWQWDSYTNRLYYDWKRIQTREIERRQVYIIGGLVLNHLVSAINALRLARKHNRSYETESWQIRVSVSPFQNTIALNLNKQF